MRDSAVQPAGEIPQDRGKIAMRIALMQKYRLADLGGDFQLGDEGLALRVGRREIAKIIEPALADGNHLLQMQKLDQFARVASRERLRMMRMHAGGAPQASRDAGRPAPLPDANSPDPRR